MYRCRMKIAIFSKDAMLTELVRSLEPLEHFTHEITVVSEENQDIMREGQLIIWNLDAPVLPSKLRARCAGDAVLVFCGSRQLIGTLPMEELEAADEFWETPLVRDYLKVRLKRIMEQIKLGYDYYMTQAYLDTAIDSIPDMLWFKSLDGIHVKVNKAFCSVVGKTREDVVGQNHCYIYGAYPRMIMKTGRLRAGSRRMRSLRRAAPCSLRSL
ncbi:MAG: PAS domain S-box protein [Clostridia bacterium]|nr:PAS domain S-box protein [Clostridia bacterium]